MGILAYQIDIPTTTIVATTSPTVSPQAPIRRRTRAQRGRTLDRDDVRPVPVVRLADAVAPVRLVPVRVVGFARRFDAFDGRGCCALRPVTGTRCCCDRVVRRSGGFRDSVTQGV
jgi:hypothetical protein